MANENSKLLDGHLYFSKEGVTLGSPDGSSEIISYGKEKVDELLDGKVDKGDLEQYVTVEVAEDKFIETTDILTNETLEKVVVAVQPLEGYILQDNGVDISLSNDETFSITAQNENRVEVGTKGNMRFIPSPNTEGFFTDGINCIDPITNQAVEAIGFHGKMKENAAYAARKMSANPTAIAAIEPQMEIDYIYIGFHDGEPSTKVTADGHFFIGDVDVGEKLKELEESEVEDYDVASSEEINQMLNEVFGVIN